MALDQLEVARLEPVVLDRIAHMGERALNGDELATRGGVWTTFL